MDEALQQTRASWNAATRRHNAWKRDQAGFLRRGGSTLFPEEIDLVGDVRGKRLLHVLCNSGQDTLSWAARGAVVTGVDLSNEAVAFARALSADSGVAGTFVESEAVAWLEASADQFDVVYGSYGCLPWIKDLPRLLRGARRVLAPGGVVVFVEFHPLCWSFDARFQLKDPYFADAPFTDPVGDYVGKSGTGLTPSGRNDVDTPFDNALPAVSYQQTTADIVNAVIGAGLRLEVLREWPFANGCRLHDGLVPSDGNRFTTPPGTPSLPLMLGVRAAS